jgi:DNA-binding MarR family transcriptional regulator
VLESRRLVRFPRERPEGSLGFMLWLTSNLWQRQIARALRPADLTLAQFALLAGIAWLERTPEPVTQAQLARYVKLDVMMTSQVLRKLEARGLISRKASESDSRANLLRLTERGADLTAKALSLVQSVESDFFGKLGGRRDSLKESFESLAESNGSER